MRDPVEVAALRRRLAGIHERACRRGGSDACLEAGVCQGPQKADRIRLCIELMTELAWITGVTGQLIAEATGLHPNTLAEDAAEAMRYIRNSVASRDDMQAMVTAQLQRIALLTSMGKQNQRQYRTAIAALELLARVQGIEAPKKHEVGGDWVEFFRLAQRDGGDGNEQPEGGEDGEDS